MTASPSPPDPALVRPDEAGPLLIASAAMGLTPRAVAGPALSAKNASLALGPDAMWLLLTTLSRGAVRALVRGGGTLPRRTLEPGGGASARGRLWERHAPPSLRFSAATWTLLAMLYQHPVHDLGRAEPAPGLLTPADELFFLGAAETCAACGFQRAVGAPVFTGSTLVRAAFPREQRWSLESAGAAPLFAGAGAVVLDGCRARLAGRVAAADKERRGAARPAESEAIALSIASGPAALASLAVATGRPDLGAFVLDAVATILDERASSGPELWSSAVRPDGPLAERQRLVQGVLPLLDTALAFQRVAARARAVGFVDDGFEAAQATRELLEPWLESGFERAAAAHREVSSFGHGSGIVAGERT